MKLSSRIKPISPLKAHAAEVVSELNDGGEPLGLTQETIALLKIIALGKKQVEQGRTVPAVEALKWLHKRIGNG